MIETSVPKGNSFDALNKVVNSFDNTTI